MSSAQPNESSQPSGRVPNGSRKRLKRLVLYAAVLLVVFLLGLVPMWNTAREHARERDVARAALRISTLQNTLASAVIDARRGEYELARQAASGFFTNLRAEIERGFDSAFNPSQQNDLRSILDTRDDIITLLARSDPASTDRLVELYNTYRLATASAPPR
jgi:hypothetical protein